MGSNRIGNNRRLPNDTSSVRNKRKYLYRKDGVPMQISTIVSDLPTSPRTSNPAERPVLKCPNPKCGLVQYQTRSGKCRKCGRGLSVTVMDMSSCSTKVSVAISNDESDAAEGVSVRIRMLREARGWKQEELAKRSKVSRGYLSRIEAGSRGASIATFEKLAEAFGISPRNLFLPEDANELLFEDPLVKTIQPLVRQLSEAQQQSILKTLRIITGPAVQPGGGEGKIFS